MTLVAVLIASVAPLVLIVLTALGEHRRGQPLPVAVVAGMFFPLTWIAWYVRDELRPRASHRTP